MAKIKHDDPAVLAAIAAQQHPSSAAQLPVDPMAHAQAGPAEGDVTGPAAPPVAAPLVPQKKKKAPLAAPPGPAPY